MENVLGVFHNDYAFFSLSRSTKISFSYLYLENLVGFLDIKLT